MSLHCIFASIVLFAAHCKVPHAWQLIICRSHHPRSFIPLSYDSHGHSCCALFVGYAMFGEVARMAKALELMLPNSQLGGWVAII